MQITLQPIPARGIVSAPGKITWCGTMVRSADGRCHLMLSVWPEARGFDGWLYHSEIGYAVAEQPDAEYRFQGVVFSGDPSPGAWDHAMVHNPWIIQHDGRFYMYYTGNTGDGTFPSHRYNQRVGLAVAERPGGPWRRLGQPLAPATPGSWDELVSCNPSVCRMADGRFIMLYRACSRPDNPVHHGDIVLGVAFAERPEGPFVRHPEPIFRREGQPFAAEDPGVFCWGGRLYAAFKDMGQNYHDRERSLLLAESADGKDWRIIQPLCTRDLPFADTAPREQFRVERPFVYMENDQPRQLFVAVRPERESQRAFSVHTGIDIQP